MGKRVNRRQNILQQDNQPTSQDKVKKLLENQKKRADAELLEDERVQNKIQE